MTDQECAQLMQAAGEKIGQAIGQVIDQVAKDGNMTHEMLISSIAGTCAASVAALVSSHPDGADIGRDQQATIIVKVAAGLFVECFNGFVDDIIEGGRQAGAA